jgi:hypothetical protein
MSNDYNKLVGKGVAGLGQNELKRRLKQHQALADKAKSKVGLEESMALMKEIGANKFVQVPNSTNYKGKEPISPLTKAVKATGKTIADAVIKTGKLAHNAYVTVDAVNYGLLPGGVKPVNPWANNVSSIARAKKKWKKLGD